MSKSSISRRLNISPATVGSLIDELMAEGLIVSLGAGPSTGGRRPQRLALNEAGPVAVGVDLGSTNVNLGVLNLTGQLVAYHTLPFRRQNGQVDLPGIIDNIWRLPSAFSPRDCLGIGLAVPGLLNLQDGIVRYAANLGWREVKLRSSVSEAVRLPVVMDRNTNAALLAEEWWGAGQATDHSLFVTLGSGIGAAMRIDGHFVRGIAGVAGEFGHIPIDPQGPLCGCGQRGCLEAMASGTAVRRRYNQLLLETTLHPTRQAGENPTEPVSLKRIIQLALDGDKLALEVLNAAAYYLGIGLTTLINLLNPAVIILGGELMDAASILLPTILQQVHNRALELSRTTVKIVASTFYGQAATIGAATLVFNEVFQQAGIYGEKEVQIH